MKENYQRKMEEQIKAIKKEYKEKPTLLLHSCCAPCSTAVLERLIENFDIKIYYYNPNTYPENEYYKRLEELKSYLLEYHKDSEIEVIESEYVADEFFNKIKGLENEAEGGKRCYACYELRMEATASLAEKMGFDYFTTVLSISPHKNAQWINEIGKELGKTYKTNFLYGDFKKKNGFKRSVELSNEAELYRQDYCGCVFSVREQ
ncbi:MAG: epoxyqueuosine reductase QueH [Tissierellales bacterium]|jgi:predicted adenine nucleotide alpha hydrolase (AANH) superfamily ATPase|nr:epoxyqueuosine reductase QueH [Tissierellales bacterium]